MRSKKTKWEITEAVLAFFGLILFIFLVVGVIFNEIKSTAVKVNIYYPEDCYELERAKEVMEQLVNSKDYSYVTVRLCVEKE